MEDVLKNLAQPQALSPMGQKVLDAAVELLRTTGELSMRKLVESAGVAGMTPYNLFGSKHGLLRALSQKELNRAVKSLQQAPVQDSLERLFAALDMGFQTFSSDEVYFRALYRAAYASGDPAMIEIFQVPRSAYWNSLLDACRDDGFLLEEGRSETITQILMYTYIGAVQRWIELTINTRQLYAEINFTLNILMLSQATPKATDRIQRRMKYWESFLYI